MHITTGAESAGQKYPPPCLNTEDANMCWLTYQVALPDGVSLPEMSQDDQVTQLNVLQGRISSLFNTANGVSTGPTFSTRVTVHTYPVAEQEDSDQQPEMIQVDGKSTSTQWIKTAPGKRQQEKSEWLAGKLACILEDIQRLQGSGDEFKRQLTTLIITRLTSLKLLKMAQHDLAKCFTDKPEKQAMLNVMVDQQLKQFIEAQEQAQKRRGMALEERLEALFTQHMETQLSSQASSSESYSWPCTPTSPRSLSLSSSLNHSEGWLAALNDESSDNGHRNDVPVTP